MSDSAADVDNALERGDAFFARLGLGRPFYLRSIEQAVTFAKSTALVDPSAVPWSSYGARNIGGRIRALAQNPDNPELLYAGSAQGGLFRSLNGGDTWAPVGGPDDVFPVGAIGIAPSNPQRVYVGTGEPGILHFDVAGVVSASEQFAAGRGLFVLNDGVAASLKREVPPLVAGAAPAAANSFARIVVDPIEPERCWMATHNGLWRRDPGPGYIQEQVNGAPPAPPALGAAVTDVLIVPDWNPARPRTLRLYAAIGAIGIFRGVFDRDAATPATATTWEAMLTVGLPLPSATGAMTWDRIRLGVCRSQPQHVYAIAEKSSDNSVLAAYYSSDAGDTWTARPFPDAGTQAWVNLYVEVHPDNPALSVAGAENLWRSKNFGATWETLIDWTNFDLGDHAQHADQHAAIFDARDPRRLWVSNDGGISMAPDVVDGQPHTDRSWRKRSHGITAAQFNDIAVHPTYPFMIGGGLQDNGTYVSFGGETWYSVNGADGGQMLFAFADPRTFIAPWQLRVERATVSTGRAASVSGSRGLINADRPPPNDVFATSTTRTETGIAAAHGPLFIPLVERHPRTPKLFLIGRKTGAVYATVNDGALFNNVNSPAAGDVTAMAYGIEAGTAADFWVGTLSGNLALGRNSPPAATAWSLQVLPGLAANTLISRIAVHPADDRYVAVSTARSSGNQQGQVFLSADRGAHWTAISNLSGVGAPQVGSLPPGPCTSLAFDPQPGATQPQVLYAGTLAGVFVVRNLPRRSSSAGAPLPAFVANWQRFNLLGADNALPLTLVKDLTVVSLPARTGPDLVAKSPESVKRFRLLAAMFGRGMFACDITQTQAPGVPQGGPRVRLYVRQTVVEDGLSYPRPAPSELNGALSATAPFKLAGDPRFPPNAVPFTDREAFDIRIDSAPFQFFEDVVDGVEFDEAMLIKPVTAGELNVVYVQAHSCGWHAAAPVTVRLYFAPGAPPPVSPAADPLPDLHADFWAHWTDLSLPAPAVAPGPLAAAWQRAGADVILSTLGPNQPAVARIEWLAPATLGSHVGLMAAISSVDDPLLPAGQPTAMKALLRRERRVAFRLAPVTAFVPDLFIRDGLDDIGRLGGVAFGGRSPDIIVVQAPLADLPGATADTANPRSADRVVVGDNHLYVRVQNRKAVDTLVDVELFWAQGNPPTSAAADPAGPASDNTKWQVVPADGAVSSVNVPANGAVLVKFKLANALAPTAGIVNALAFIALIKSHDGLDREPLRSRVTDAGSFSRFFLQLADANNAALRTVRYAA